MILVCISQELVPCSGLKYLNVFHIAIHFAEFPGDSVLYCDMKRGIRIIYLNYASALYSNMNILLGILVHKFLNHMEISIE